MTTEPTTTDWDATRPWPVDVRMRAEVETPAPSRPESTHRVPVDAIRPAAASAAPVVTLKLVAKGFKAVELQLLNGTVRVSQRRTPRLELLDDDHAQDADVVLIDSRDAHANAWAQRCPWLKDKPVIWVDASHVREGHTLTKRPVQWPVLPMLLARALEPGLGAAARADVADARADAIAAAQVGSNAARPVLVVDDSLAARVHLRGLLERRGFAVLEAESVDAAMAVATAQPLACVFMDVVMADTDGYEGCRRIKARLRGAQSVPVVMLTSKTSPFDRIRGKMAGCDAYLTKPSDPEQLYEVLTAALAASPASAASGADERRPKSPVMTLRSA